MARMTYCTCGHSKSSHQMRDFNATWKDTGLPVGPQMYCIGWLCGCREFALKPVEQPL